MSDTEDEPSTPLPDEVTVQAAPIVVKTAVVERPVSVTRWLGLVVFALVVSYYRNGRSFNRYMIPAVLFSKLYLFMAVCFWVIREKGLGQMKSIVEKYSKKYI